jgi:chromosomal replication initiation ATPase DnaA
MKVLSLWKGEILIACKTMNQIGALVAENHNLTVKDLKGQSRLRPIVAARQEAMWLMAEEIRPSGTPRYTNAQIGGWFNRDHTTVIHGRRAHAKRAGLDLGWRGRHAEAVNCFDNSETVP